jgi:sporulation protein YlmC with PRC-barrel domain
MSNEIISSDVGTFGRLSSRVLSASSLNDDDIYNLAGEKLGSIKEFMMDINTGRVCYVVLSFGGFLSMGEKLFAVPWSALTVDTENKRFLMDTNEERLKEAPGFDTDKWPNMADPTWEKKVHSYYGTQSNTTF